MRDAGLQLSLLPWLMRIHLLRCPLWVFLTSGRRSKRGYIQRSVLRFKRPCSASSATNANIVTSTSNVHEAPCHPALASSCLSLFMHETPGLGKYLTYARPMSSLYNSTQISVGSEAPVPSSILSMQTSRIEALSSLVPCPRGQFTTKYDIQTHIWCYLSVHRTPFPEPVTDWLTAESNLAGIPLRQAIVLLTADTESKEQQ